MITDLLKAVNTISAEKTKLFGGVYSHGKLDYDSEYDELSTVMGAVIGNTQYSFSLNVDPADNQIYIPSFGKKIYKVHVQEFDQLRDSAIVPGELLLSFLLNAKIQIQDNAPKLKLIYTHSNV